MKANYSLRKFNKLPMLDQYGLLKLNGVYLNVRIKTEEHHISLFSLHDYYVEVRSDVEHGNLVKLQAFGNTQKLNPFLKEIDLSFIYSYL